MQTHIIKAMEKLNFSVAERYHRDAHVEQSSKMICIACLKFSCTQSVGVRDSRTGLANEIAERSTDLCRKQLVRRGTRSHEVQIHQVVVFVVFGHCRDVGQLAERKGQQVCFGCEDKVVNVDEQVGFVGEQKIQVLDGLEKNKNC